MDLVLNTAPAVLVVTASDAKAHLRVDHSSEDTLIATYLAAAIDAVDGRNGFLRRALITQTWTLTLDSFPVTDRIELPLPPLQSVTHVKYYDGDQVQQTLSTDAYTVVTSEHVGYILLNDGYGWPGVGLNNRGLEIKFVCGYGDAASDVPAGIRTAILAHVAELYAYRGDDPMDRRYLSRAWYNMLAPYRTFPCPRK